MARKSKKNKNKNNNKNNNKNTNVVLDAQLTDINSNESVSSEAESLTFRIRKPEDSVKPPKGCLKKIVFWLKEKQIFSKIFVICFALAIFSYAYFMVDENSRNALSYVGLMLAMIAAYVEILIIRDHLWVIEGSMPESKKWRELFFSPSTIRKQKFRKIIVLLFALIVFVFFYKMKIPGYRDSLAFIGLILMITMVYYEILSIRDEIANITRSMQQFIVEKIVAENKFEEK